MRYKVVQTKQGKVGVDESADIKEQDYCDYPPFGIGQIKNIDNELCFVTIPIKSKGSLTQRLYQCKDECQKVIASINHSISLNVPMVIVEDDIDLGRIAKKEYLRILDNCENRDFKDSLFFGHKAAKQKDVYSEEDLRKAMLHSSNCNSSLIGVNNYIKQLKQEYIELEMEDYEVGEGWVGDNYNGEPITEYGTRIKTNRVDGQLIAYVKNKIMKEITLNNKNYLLVEVPDDSNESEIDEGFLYVYDIKGKLTSGLQSKNLDNCKIIDKMSNILKDEDICKGLVEPESGNPEEGYFGYKNYTLNEWVYCLNTATDSFLSYLQSIELDMTKQYLLIQKTGIK